jgi:crotonobetainyl-CoA:carnitine CoA-transferase CaiB-like acyl-CoA transferase
MFKMIASPLQFDETAPDLTRAPDHGEHTDEVLGQLGLSMEELMELKIKGAIL